MSRGKWEQAGKRTQREQKESRRRRLGFTNMLALLLVALLAAGLAGGFILAYLSIRHQYTGALACYTVVFTPIGTALSVVLARVVDKNRAENTGPNGVGVVYASAQATGFNEASGYSENSPPI